ncbi:MAG TPA: TetR family transcriptional regulator [Micromonosporaceae bacterium]|jgi:AcrR family transcriptional regulator|nr:TetR family transcriptional regulator [Micromonosporaceae bacterium]
MARRTGRRPGNPDTREAILAAAREAFAERGFDGASIRAIATSAEVDPALVHHYFGTKEQLFVETVRPPIDPAEMLPKIFAGGDLDGLGARLVTAFLAVWEHPVSGPAFEALVRSAVSNKLSGRLIREFFAVQILRRVIRELRTDVDPAEIPMRATLVASQLFGLAVIRYILKFEPLASAPVSAVVTAAAPNVQRYLTGDLD